MHELPPFFELLTRLAKVRGLDHETMARRAAVPEAEIASAFNDSEPNPASLCSLASFLGLHRSDLFVIAGRPVPDELAPRDVTARHEISELAWPLTFLPRAIPELHTLVRSLPTLPRPARPPEAASPRRPHPNTPGGLILRLLHNRNLDLTAISYYLLGLGGGPMLSASTIYLIGEGRKTLTPDLLANLGAVLDIASPDLHALTGTYPAAGVQIHHEASEAAELIWDARRLTAEQLRPVVDRAHDIRHERAEELGPRHQCHCTGRS